LKKEEGGTNREDAKDTKEEGRRKKEELGIKSTVSAIKNFLTIGRGCYQLLNFFQAGEG
jgi:hypothetical protein